ncbi:hypothetical protein Poli38472_009093 [Pythium oligandrum]|uniref:Peptidase A1 domain-containing protein n=1 Tax=Pythium oligandrum TaxID=41045 RepID=A0A8K1CJT5_PYTOL|nr:hypothetical protein Poli38472_009093 [Pythium oligandrum]|eukprot:TMW64926.1 hypothetical protein Poli38472_009093 [Pythium oligandrum]
MLRLEVQQERIRRRLGEVPENATSGQDVTVSSLVYNEVPLGVGYGTHYTELYLGLPVQRASMIVDTGSHLTALPCTSCHGCGEHTDPLFDLAKSKTAKYMTCKEYSSCNACTENRCHIRQSYTEGSMWSAIVVEDLTWLGGFSSKRANAIVEHYGVRFPFGCQVQETGLFITQKENGIIGFGRDKATLMTYMLKAGRIEHDIFTMCFSPTGGSLVLGGVDLTHHKTQIAYSPLVSHNSGYYPVQVKKILVGDKPVDVTENQINSGKGVIVDSGTTDTFFVSGGSRSFNHLFSKLAGMDYSERRMDLSAKELAKLPNITIILAGANGEEDIALVVPATKYLSKADDGSYYGNFHFTERSGGVLGASTMVGYDVIFDTEGNRVGFAESDCDALKGRKYSEDDTELLPKKPDGPVLSPIDELGSSSSSGSGSLALIAASNKDNQSTTSSSFGFFGQILAVSAVGIVVVAVWLRMRRRGSWTELNESETVRGPLRGEILDDTDTPRASGSPPQARSPGSPGTPPPLGVAVPRFTIGSDSESDHENSPRIVIAPTENPRHGYSH